MIYKYIRVSLYSCPLWFSWLVHGSAFTSHLDCFGFEASSDPVLSGKWMSIFYFIFHSPNSRLSLQLVKFTVVGFRTTKVMDTTVAITSTIK